jgi:hypothetical protein
MGRGGVNDADLGIFHQSHRLARGVVRETQNHHIGGVQHFALGLDILSPARVDRDHLNVAPAGEPVANPEAGSAGFAVDEHLGCHSDLLSWLQKRKERLG